MKTPIRNRRATGAQKRCRTSLSLWFVTASGLDDSGDWRVVFVAMFLLVFGVYGTKVSIYFGLFKFL